VDFATYPTLAPCYFFNFATNNNNSRFISFPPMHRLDRGDVWKNKARSLQLQLRDRFRVVVDRHWRRRHHRTISPDADGYFSSTLQRWLNRFRDFRRDSLPSSTSFYRKRGIRFNSIIYSLKFKYCMDVRFLIH